MQSFLQVGLEKARAPLPTKWEKMWVLNLSEDLSHLAAMCFGQIKVDLEYTAGWFLPPSPQESTKNQ